MDGRGRHAGERDRGETAGLARIDPAVIGRAIDVLAGKSAVSARLWPAVPVGPLVADLARGRRLGTAGERSD